MEKNRKLTYTTSGILVCVIIVVTILIPELISRFYDNSILENIILEEKNDDFGGYKYNLSADEKLYVLANALNNRVLPQSDYFAAIRWQERISNTQTQSYAFQPVFRDSENNRETQEAALNALKEELDMLTEKGIFPALDYSPDASLYEAALFSAIDILEPKRNVTVWQINYSGGIIRKGLVDCVMDAQTNKLYSFSIRDIKTWEQYQPDEAIKLWADYLGISAPEPYMPVSLLAEDATYYQKYSVSGMEGDITIVTIGYYEGVQEFFIKITK